MAAIEYYGTGRRKTSTARVFLRPGKGVITIKTSARNGKVSAIRVVAEDHHLILISDKGKLIRIRV